VGVARLNLVHLGLGQIRLGRDLVELGPRAYPIALLLHAQRFGRRDHVGAGDPDLHVPGGERGELLGELGVHLAARVRRLAGRDIARGGRACASAAFTSGAAWSAAGRSAVVSGSGENVVSGRARTSWSTPICRPSAAWAVARFACAWSNVSCAVPRSTVDVSVSERVAAPAWNLLTEIWSCCRARCTCACPTRTSSSSARAAPTPSWVASVVW